MFAKRTWASIDLDALKQNASYIQSLLGETKMIATVKADGYGHGAIHTARALEKMGVEWFSVSNIDEAISLRENGIEGNIIIFGYTPLDAAKDLTKYRIIQTVFSLKYAQGLSQALCDRCPVHIKLDTGMGRLGIDGENPKQALSQIEEIYGMKNICVQGIFSHFSHADSLEPQAVRYTKRQEALFLDILQRMEEKGLPCGMRHLQNSAAILTGVGAGLDLARPGIILYGLNPSAEVTDSHLLPVLSLRTVVSMVKWMEAKHFIGYGCTYQTERKTKIATVPIGYADGYSRRLSGKGKAIVKGKVVPVIGAVCMDQLMLDVTDVPDIHAGEEVTLIGRREGAEISAQDLAEQMGTIHYEVICMIGKRVPRIYYENGKQTAVVQMI